MEIINSARVLRINMNHAKTTLFHPGLLRKEWQQFQNQDELKRGIEALHT